MTEIRTEYHESEPIATVTISDPDRKNAVTEEATEDIAEAFRVLDADDDVRAVILTGDGDAFCAGANLSSVSGSPTAESIDRGFHGAVREIATCSKPVIGKVQGHAVGAGAALAVAPDVVVAGESAQIGFSFSKIGLTADTGATFLLPRLVGVRTATELLMTGRIVDAAEADDLDLVSEVVPDSELDDRVAERASELANGPTRALASLRRLILRANANGFEEHLELESREQIRMFHTNDSMEGIGAFAAGREPDFQGE